MNDKEEILINIQLGLFFESTLEKPENHYLGINTKLGDIFNNTPTILPIPKDSRLDEVPVVTLSSTDGVYICNIARSRIDLIVAGEGKGKFETKKDVTVKIFENLFSYLDENRITLKRIGFITRFFIEETEQDKVIEKILKSDFMDLHKDNEEVTDFVESYVKYVNKINFLDIPINNYTTIEKFFANITGVGQEIKGVLITRDFNTNPEVIFNNVKKIDFSISNFINESEKRFCLNEIKELLWPTQE